LHDVLREFVFILPQKAQKTQKDCFQHTEIMRFLCSFGFAQDMILWLIESLLDFFVPM